MKKYLKLNRYPKIKLYREYFIAVAMYLAMPFSFWFYISSFGKRLRALRMTHPNVLRGGLLISSLTLQISYHHMPLNTLAQFTLHAYFAYIVFYLRHACHAGQHLET